MTLRQLEMFVAIVEMGSFSKAAERLYVAQPSISQQMRFLEEELGERILVRSRNRKLYLTEAGNILKRHCDHILRQTQILKMEISALTNEPTGDVRIGIGGHHLTSMLAPALLKFQVKFPKVRVGIVNGTTPQITELLKNNSLDLGLLSFPVESKDLRTEVLFTEEMVLVIKKQAAA